MVDLILEHLEALVECDTTNPPRDISAESQIVRYVMNQLRASRFEIEFEDLGDGCLLIHARRGNPRILFNVHLDTVPVDAEWAGNPFELRIENDRAIGLGACDIKGAAAALLAAIETTDAPAGILFTTDEESGTSRCVHSFLDRHPEHVYDVAIIAEPTACRAVLAHRGLVSAEIEFKGRAGHASGRFDASASAVHRAVAWCDEALSIAADFEPEIHENEPRDLRFNIGRIEGGTKANVIASHARVVFGIRPTTAHAVPAVLDRLAQPLDADAGEHIRLRFEGPALAATREADEFAKRHHLPVADPVDFWTEASLFARGGFPSLVLGPGHIAQAHTAGEWVAIEQLQRAASLYAEIIAGQRACH